MHEEKVSEIRKKLGQALTLIKEALNLGIPLLKSEQKGKVIALWEAFLREFLGFVRQKSKESGNNLLGYISIRKIWAR